MWNEIKSDDDLKRLKSSLACFHDSCIKEMHYISGAFVNERLAMIPINKDRVLRVVFQRQYCEDSVIELEFAGLKHLQLMPVDEEYTCEILDASLFRQNGWIYWCDCDGLSEEDLAQFSGTFICASDLRWRALERSLGEQPIYQHSTGDGSLC